MVDFRRDRVAAFRQPADIVQTLEDEHLPKRPSHVDWSRVEARHVNAKLAPVARFRQPTVAHMTFQVEMLIVHPVGEIEFQRYTDKPAPEQRAHVYTPLDMRQNFLEAHGFATGNGCRIHDYDRRYMCQIVV